MCLIWLSRSGDGRRKSWYRLASRDVSEGYIHRKFEVSSLETKIEHCPVMRNLPSLKKTDFTCDDVDTVKLRYNIHPILHTPRYNIHFDIPYTSIYHTPRYTVHLDIPYTSIYRTPRYTVHLDKTYTYGRSRPRFNGKMALDTTCT